MRCNFLIKRIYSFFIKGNKTPHIHWHVIPRFENDRHFPNSHWGEIVRDGSAVALDEKTIDSLNEKITAHIECALNSASS